MSLPFVRGILVTGGSLHKESITQRVFPYHDVVMCMQSRRSDADADAETDQSEIFYDTSDWHRPEMIEAYDRSSYHNGCAFIDVNACAIAGIQESGVYWNKYRTGAYWIHIIRKATYFPWTNNTDVASENSKMWHYDGVTWASTRFHSLSSRLFSEQFVLSDNKQQPCIRTCREGNPSVPMDSPSQAPPIRKAFYMELAHWGRDKISAILHMTYSNAFLSESL